MVPDARAACYAPGMNPDWDPGAYAYDAPERLVAHEPASPRDAARLLVYDRATREIAHRVFRDLPELLERGSLLVLNDTRVVAARFTAHKETGGAVRVLFLRMRGPLMEALADRMLAEGSEIRAAGGRMLRVAGREGSVYLLEPGFGDVTAFLAAHGTTPLPPYIDTPLAPERARDEYQAVFARKDGSAAAPTASLHFTEELLERIRGADIGIATVTLHVGLGTFAPLTDDAVAAGKLHHEWYDVPQETADAVREAKASGRPVVAVGTTVTRALESAARTGSIVSGPGETDLFIRPGYAFKAVDQLVTNFHVPRSSLMQLVASLTGREELLRIYADAVDQEYRLFSFGDAMLVR